jgi:hypothetical protein
MAVCPKCHAVMGTLDTRCPSCGYDFPDESPRVPRTGFAYSALADVSLIVGSLAAGLGCMAALLYAIGAVASGEYWAAFFTAPIAFFLCFANLVVFIRIQNA